ncbi:MAG: 7TM diverse intracellular signaling domain-containing protein [Poseidonibacter sp.]|uniref:7TM diverse intracellular signaling domain-containing protein n=1 Tax=Poseidonibacter sp. TaxID=2321188 RepID=UPI00359DD039
MNSIFATIILPVDIKKKNNFIIESFYDETNNLTIDTIKNQKFEQSPSQFSFGHKRANLWFKLQIHNQSLENKFILYFTEPYYNEVVLYKKINDKYIEDKNGLIVKLENRSILNHKPTFELLIKENEIKTYYIKANSKLTSSNEFEIYTKKHFNTIYGQYQDFLYMFYFGTIFFITLINLFLYIRLKEKIYLYYSAYTFFYLLWVSAYSGLILHTIIDGYFHEFIMVTSLFVMFLILFSAEFLNIKTYLPKMYKFLNIFALVFALLSILIVYSFQPWFEVMNNLASVAFLLLFSIAIYIWKKENDKNVKYYLFAMTIYMITISLMSAMVNGWIESNDINRYSFLFGSFFEIIFFALILTNRFYIAQNEKLKIQKELILFKTNNEILLENQIKERTSNIKSLVEEKELLLKELYHRVKNNFHMVIGLLSIESNIFENKDFKNSFSKIITRIKAMSLINEYLYESDTLSKIDCADYIEKIIDEITIAYEKENILINKNIELLNIDIDSAVSLGMIVNEILTNSIKHFDKKDICIINLEIKKEKNQIILTIKDNGKGFIENNKQKGLGLKLIKQFSNKLAKSNYKFIQDNGTKFILSFTSI